MERTKRGDVMVVFHDGSLWFPFKHHVSGNYKITDFEVFSKYLAEILEKEKSNEK